MTMMGMMGMMMVYVQERDLPRNLRLNNGENEQSWFGIGDAIFLDKPLVATIKYQAAWCWAENNNMLKSRQSPWLSFQLD